MTVVANEVRRRSRLVEELKVMKKKKNSIKNIFVYKVTLNVIFNHGSVLNML